MSEESNAWKIDRLQDNGCSRQQLTIIYGVGVSTIYRYFPVGG
ncbi:TPA: helix-turn-helix domain-containing protein [Morganella morganii]|nr:helix-turn-helix domain-containing protein [Morganella morganii]